METIPRWWLLFVNCWCELDQLNSSWTPHYHPREPSWCWWWRCSPRCPRESGRRVEVWTRWVTLTCCWSQWSWVWRVGRVETPQTHWQCPAPPACCWPGSSSLQHPPASPPSLSGRMSRHWGCSEDPSDCRSLCPGWTWPASPDHAPSTHLDTSTPATRHRCSQWHHCSQWRWWSLLLLSERTPQDCQTLN